MVSHSVLFVKCVSRDCVRPSYLHFLMRNEPLISAFNDLIFFSGFKQFDLDALLSASHHGSCSWVLLGFFVLQVYCFYLTWNIFQPLSFQRFPPLPSSRPPPCPLQFVRMSEFVFLLNPFAVSSCMVPCFCVFQFRNLSAVSLCCGPHGCIAHLPPGAALASLIHME